MRSRALPLLLLLCGLGGSAVEDGDGLEASPVQADATPLCPTWGSHFQCDVARCLRYEDQVNGPHCTRHCVMPAPTCLHRQYVCDGVVDCEDGTDEAGCVQCSLAAFSCDGVCRRRALICDPAYSHCRPAGAFCPVLASPCQSQGPGNLSCDGVPDCDAERDELACKEPHQCHGGAFFCDGRCLRASRRCDGVRHCEDGSDEAGCPAGLRVVAVVHKDAENVVTKRECFECGNGRCVPPSVKCDGVDDCGNQRDEKRCFAPVCADGRGRNCVATKCNDQGIPCSSGYRCGRLKWACDGHPHCDAASDEPPNCHGPPDVFLCRGGAGPDAEPRPAASWCDGQPDCAEAEDEADCPGAAPLERVYCADNRTGHGHVQGGRAVECAAPPRRIFCHDGSPRLETTRCDGVPDCAAGEDEEGCSQCYDGAVLCDGRCVVASRRCDGVFDCNDGADERGCHDDLLLGSAFFHPRVCGPGRFDCGDRCIDAQYVCDGTRDCESQADEANCNTCKPGSVLCAGRCVRACPSASPPCPHEDATPEAVCDGVLDCPDGADVQTWCSTEGCAGLLCDGGVCRPRSARCDGLRDCVDGRDEIDCPDGVVNTTTRETWRRVNHRVEFTWIYSSIFTAAGITTNVTTVINDTTAVTTTVVHPSPPTPEPLACPTTTTMTPTTTPESAPTPAQPLRGQRPRNRQKGGGRRQGRPRRKQGKQSKQQQRRQRKQEAAEE